MRNIHKEDEKTLKAMAVKLPVIPEVNHYRRLKKAFVDEGLDGVKKYLDKNGAQMTKS